MFGDRLARALARADRNEAPVALMFLDLDRFKAVNGVLGHEAGDDLLKNTARRLDGSVRETRSKIGRAPEAVGRPPKRSATGDASNS